NPKSHPPYGGQNPKSAALALCLALALTPGCLSSLVDVNVMFVDKQAALRNQVLGSYQDLSGDLLALASVRGVDEEGKPKEPPPQSDSKRRATYAMQSREFNKDDIELFKATGFVGENNEGYLTVLETDDLKKDAKYAAFVKAIVDEENADRRVIMERVIEVNETFSNADLPTVQKVFASMNRDQAKKGWMVQLDDGRWVKKD
ncbi:MAG: DUF1318 domain-containing protein, partial [Planctomycetes bacterium]|nr:DUF1318 domain-containing protein [Planctomycetota bacterium]